MIFSLKLSERDSNNLERIANALDKMADIPIIHSEYKPDNNIGMGSPDFEKVEEEEREIVYEQAARLLEQNDNNDFFAEDGLPVDIIEKL